MSTIVRPYESVVIMHPDSTEELQKQLIKKNKEIIESHKGSINHVDTWGKRSLGNAIKKTRRGIYFHTTFSADTHAVAELERTMRINDHVLRFVHTRLKDGTSLPAFVEQWKKDLTEGLAKEKDREAKAIAKRQARQAARSEQ
jgi:small subunit ribosomal protein S6